MPDLIFAFEDGSECLAHYGVKGMKWGVRRYRNEDGSATPEGKRRAKLKTAIKIGGTVVGAGLIAFGAYKTQQYIRTKRTVSKHVMRQAENRINRLYKEKDFKDVSTIRRDKLKEYKRKYAREQINNHMRDIRSTNRANKPRRNPYRLGVQTNRPYEIAVERRIDRLNGNL